MALKNKGKTFKKSATDLRDKFKKRDKNILEKTYKERSERSGGSSKTVFNSEILEKFHISEFRPSPEGDFYFEILPGSYDSDIPYYMEIPVHFNVGVGNDSMICPQRYNQSRCFRCEEQQKKIRALTRGDKYTDEIKKLFPSDRVVYIGWNRTEELAKDKKPEYKLSVWAAPKTKVHEELQNRARNKKTEMSLDISDVSEDGEGRTVYFELTKQGDFPTYKGIDLKERDEPIPDEILELLDEFIEYAKEEGYQKHPFEVLLHIPTYDEVKNAMLSEMDEDDEDEDEEKPSSRKKPEKPKKKEVDEEEAISEFLDELKEELLEEKIFKIKKFIKENKLNRGLLDIEEKEDMVDGILEELYADLIEGDRDLSEFEDIPF